MAESDPPAKKDFFISYNKADREWAEWVAWHLEESGHYSVVVQAWDFGAASNFVVEVDRGIRECERVIAVLSPDYLASHFTQPEWAAYFAQDPTGAKRFLIPIRVRDCDLTGLLAQIVHTDVFGKSEADAQAALLDAVKTGRRKPGSAPGFPGRKVGTKPRFPGSLPDIWNVPHQRNPNFTEPGQRLTEMREALRSGKPAALTQALAGLGGVGKTQLAIEYAYRYAADYSLVWWIRSEQVATLAADYAALATALDLPEKNAAEQPVIVAAVREALLHRRDWLLVFDNANAPEEIRDYLAGMGGHVLITSRHAAWGGVAQKVDVKKWTAEVATEFLLKRTGQADLAAAGELARELDYLPLALEQAAAYIDSAQKTLSGYLVMFRQYQLALLKRGKTGTGYPATVATTWELSLQQLESESPGGVALLQLCAFLAPDDIHRDVIVSGAERLPPPLRGTVNDGLAFDEAVSAIRRYSLIDASGDSTFSMHRLVQAVIRDRLDLPGRRIWAEAAVTVINEAFPSNSGDVRKWKECDRLLPHAIATAEFAEELDAALEETARLVNEMGVYARGRGEYKKARTAYERALRIAEKVYGVDHSNVGTCVNNLGLALSELGDLSAAKMAYERALDIQEKSFGPDHLMVAVALNNVGTVLRDLGDLPGARTAQERALNIKEKALGLHHPQVAITLNNLGYVLLDLGDLQGAKIAYERALKIDEDTYGLDHPTVAIRAHNLGRILGRLGNLSGAKAAIERALRIDEKALGSDHPNMAFILGSLGGVLDALGDRPAAIEAFRRGLAICKKSLGEDHPRTRMMRESLTLLLP